MSDEDLQDGENLGAGLNVDAKPYEPVTPASSGLNATAIEYSFNGTVTQVAAYEACEDDMQRRHEQRLEMHREIYPAARHRTFTHTPVRAAELNEVERDRFKGDHIFQVFHSFLGADAGNPNEDKM